MKILLFFILYFFAITIYAQKETNVWVLANKNAFYFDNDSVFKYNNTILGKNESSSSICDKNGNLLFYSNGITLYNRYNKIVKNGSDLGYPISPNESSSRQGTLFLKHKDNDTIIYLFSSDYQGRNGGLVYAIINIKGNKDSGEVISKKNKLISPINEPITAVNHQNGRDIWICVHGYGNDIFYFFLLTKNGISKCENTQKTGVMHFGMSGIGAQTNMKFSVDGKFISTFQIYDWQTECFNFDNINGKIIKKIFLLKDTFVVGIEFSNNSKNLYLRSGLNIGLIQLDLVNYNIQRVLNFDDSNNCEQLQIGLNNKIYSVSKNKNNLFILNHPNKSSFNSNPVVVNSFFEYNNETAVPNFNQSYFYTPSINYSYEMNCLQNSIQFWGYDTFAATSHTWESKKLYSVNSYLLIGNSKDINYTFNDTGTYLVRYIAGNGNRTDTVEKTIVLYDKIKRDFLGRDTAFEQGNTINKTLFAPLSNHCVQWYFNDTLKNNDDTYNANQIGRYICKVTNKAFCEVWDTINIRECLPLTMPSIYKKNTDTIFCSHPTADTFRWYRNHVFIKETYADNNNLSFIKLTDTGSYRVEAIKHNYCNKSTQTFLVNKLSNKLNLFDLGIRVFPNPSEGEISIQSETPFKLKINTIVGQKIYEGENINSINLPKGMYFITFEVDGFKVVEKLVVF